jgi:short-subunit dehydrogenase
VAICARRGDRLEQVAEEVRQSGGRALPVVADVSRDDEVEAFIARTVDTFGSLDVLVSNAGYGVYGSIDQITPEQMRRVMDVNFLGTYYASRAALAVFRRQQRGHLIMVSSIAGKRGIPYMGAYSATKFAQVGLAECLRAELRESAIHVTVVLPVSTETEFFSVMTRESGYATRAAGPRQSADDVADAIARAVARPVPEAYPYRKARGLSLFNAIAPGWCDQVVKRWGRKPV